MYANVFSMAWLLPQLCAAGDSLVISRGETTSSFLQPSKTPFELSGDNKLGNPNHLWCAGYNVPGFKKYY